MFIGDENNKVMRFNNDMMNSVNPAKWLVAFCVQFSDYHLVAIDEDQDLEDEVLNKSVDAEIKPSSGKLEDKKSDRLG